MLSWLFAGADPSLQQRPPWLKFESGDGNRRGRRDCPERLLLTAQAHREDWFSRSETSPHCGPPPSQPQLLARTGRAFTNQQACEKIQSRKTAFFFLLFDVCFHFSAVRKSPTKKWIITGIISRAFCLLLHTFFLSLANSEDFFCLFFCTVEARLAGGANQGSKD